MPTSILDSSPLGHPWSTPDPFLFCVYHQDSYPAGNAHMGPAVSLAGRDIGMDFAGKDGWRMYHGETVPGFPAHPHRGFETVTVVRQGLLDHADSLGATARYGQGDVQWLTAGRGIQHSEMFPLLNPNAANPLELFQIWLNLPRSHKMADPYFAMLWNNTVPHSISTDAEGHRREVTVVAGQFNAHRAPPPPPDSWAAQAQADVAIWTVKLDPHAQLQLPAAQADSNRTLYFFRGSSLSLDATPIPANTRIDLRPEATPVLENGPDTAELLLLQGRPLKEPVVQHGPFVMNSPGEVRQAFMDYQATQFGGWPWDRPDPVHGRDPQRFAKRADGSIEKPQV